jgi:hypothetical protein
MTYICMWTIYFTQISDDWGGVGGDWMVKTADFDYLSTQALWFQNAPPPDRG